MNENNENGNGNGVLTMPMNPFLAFFEVLLSPKWISGKKRFPGVRANPIYVTFFTWALLMIAVLFAVKSMPLWLVTMLARKLDPNSPILVFGQLLGYGAAVVCFAFSIYFAATYRRIYGQVNSFVSANALTAFAAAKFPIVVMILLSMLFFGLSQILAATAAIEYDALWDRVNRVTKYDAKKLMDLGVTEKEILALDRDGFIETAVDRQHKIDMAEKAQVLYYVFMFESTVLSLDCVAFLFFMVPSVSIEYNLEQFGVYDYFAKKKTKQIQRSWLESSEDDQDEVVAQSVQNLVDYMKLQKIKSNAYSEAFIDMVGGANLAAGKVMDVEETMKKYMQKAMEKVKPKSKENKEADSSDTNNSIKS